MQRYVRPSRVAGPAAGQHDGDLQHPKPSVRSSACWADSRVLSQGCVTVAAETLLSECEAVRLSAVRSMSVSVTDLFCGAGGSTCGIASHPTAKVELALNHSPTAVSSHRSNHAHVHHECVDLSQADPARWWGTDVVWASPECTFFSSARQTASASARRAGGKSAAVDSEAQLRSRATGFDLLRWLDTWQHQVAIVENVIRWRSWNLFPTVLDGLERLGYDHDIVYLNAALTGRAATWRDRMFLVAWKRGLQKPDLEVTAAVDCEYCGRQTGRQTFTSSFREREAQVAADLKAGRRKTRMFSWGRYRRDYELTCCRCGHSAPAVVQPASTILDVTAAADPVMRTPPLADDTMQRLKVAAHRYGTRKAGGPEVRHVIVLNYAGSRRVWDATEAPLNTITGVDSHGLLTLPTMVGNTTLTDRQSEKLLSGATYRMLTVDELKAAMGFPATYHLDGTDRDQCIQVGMAVAPAVATWLTDRTAPVVQSDGRAPVV